MAFFHPNLRTFLSSNPADMDARLRLRPSRWEVFAFALAAGAVAIFIWLDIRVGYFPFDYDIYVRTARGDLLQFYYPDWILPLFWLWSKLPFYWGYALWNIVNILCIFFAARVFGGRGGLALLTFQMFYCLFQGQIVGLLVGGLALGWWGLAHRRWHLAGLGFWLASTKFQIGLPFGLLLLLMADIRWIDRLRVLILPVLLSLLSLVVFPAWPLHLWERIRDYAPYDWASISFWRWIGPVSLLLWLPPLLLPLEKPKRFLALAAAIPLSLPYFQQTDLLALYVLPVGWLPVALGNLGFLFFKYYFAVLPFLWVVPLIIYLSAVMPAVWALMRRTRQTQRDTKDLLK